jgi:hypothetical protein
VEVGARRHDDDDFQAKLELVAAEHVSIAARNLGRGP